MALLKAPTAPSAAGRQQRPLPDVNKGLGYTSSKTRTGCKRGKEKQPLSLEALLPLPTARTLRSVFSQWGRLGSSEAARWLPGRALPERRAHSSLGRLSPAARQAGGARLQVRRGQGRSAPAQGSAGRRRTRGTSTIRSLLPAALQRPPPTG